MWFLLGTTLTASFFDSLNPSAIAQQMLLQAMVKKKRHIWFFICGIGTANLIMGLAIYYGIATWVSKFLTKIVNAYPLYVYGAAAIGGIVLLGAGIWLIIKTRQSNAGKNNNGCEETENVKAPAQLSPVSLFIIPAMIVSLVGEYNEYSAHAEVVGDVAPVLSDKWTGLWKWYIGMTLGLLGSILLMLIIPILGLLVALVTAIGTIVVSILKLVYLYRTAKVFREYRVPA